MTQPASVGCLILAAGLSSRMGSPKTLLPWGGNITVIEHITRTAQAAQIGSVWVITGHAAERVAPLVTALGAQVVYNNDYAKKEILSSLKTGLRALPDSCGAALVLLGDMPFMTAEVIRAVVSVWNSQHPMAVAPTFNGQRGHPILFDRALWPEILALPDGSAPRAMLQAQPDLLCLIPVGDEGILTDLDTPEDYRRLRKF